MFDTHTHTRMSSDSTLEPEDAIAAAHEKGLGIIFTEHYDGEYIENETDFRVNARDYLIEYSQYRNDTVLLGIEIGLTHMGYDKNRHIASSEDFDYVLGSVHMVGETDIYIDLNKSPHPTVTKENYLDYVLRMVRENDFFDALGHIDYPCRYMQRLYPENPEIEYKAYKEVYDAIFKTLVQKEMPLELNTRRLDDKKAYEALYGVFKGYREQGGRYITVGSDAHHAKNIGFHFSSALDIADALSLIPVYFKKRKIYYA